MPIKLISGSSDKLTFDLMVDGVLKQRSSPSTFPTDTWCYIVCTFDGTDMRFYINAGTPVTLNAPGMIDTTTQPLYIGSQDGGQRFINGIIALPRIHNRALMALEIENHFQREKYLFGVW